MSLKIESVRYGENNVYSAYVVYPERAKLPLPSVVVLQEAWGVDAHIEDITRRFAEAGYVAFAPDIYARNGERPAPLTKERTAEVLKFFNALPPGKAMDPEAQKAGFASKTPEETARIQESQQTIFGGLGKPEHMDPVLAGTAFLRDSFAPSKGRKVGVVGFCMGGGLASQTASRDSRLAIAISLYGRGLDDAAAATVSCPIVSFCGSDDAHIAGGIPAFAETMEKHGKKFRSVVYENCGHAFFNDARPSYDVDAARDAFVQILTEFRKYLV
ncbi:MAG: dienelactone hydrolase family protein [Polyangiaceae bacterium]